MESGLSERRAIYAGSFDPVTNGHVDLVRRAAVLFEHVVVAVGNNPAKRTLFSMAERTAMVEQVVGAPSVEVVAFEGLLVDAARRHGAQVILRGLRGMADLDAEFRYGLANRDLAGIETLFMLTEPRNIFVSSSLVREIASNGGDVSRYVPAEILPLLRDKLPGMAPGA